MIGTDWMNRLSWFFVAACFVSMTACWAAEAAPPYPSSPLIERVEWAPAPEIVRLAPGGDNWPLAWADDDALYTAYGDGNGFEPFVPEKLSLGFAKVLGTPPAIEGINIRSESGERTGDDKQGKKASGLLSVRGVLYMWARNAGNAQLAWSPDHGQTWTWSDWRLEESFGCPVFLQFGRDCEDSRDEYVFVVSHDHDSAYEPADRMVMARAPLDRIRDREAYEFFREIGPDGQPVWTRDIRKRGAVFEHRSRCWRSGISYNPALKRYLWCQILPGESPRFAGGFGIYDAPEPWGPWTTAYFTETWDVGPGETSSIPPKWISADGRNAWLVFSGDDAFSVRKMSFHIRPSIYPKKEWMETAPEAQGVDSARLNAAVEYLKDNSGADGVMELAIVRHGCLIWKGESVDKVHGIWSLTKSFTGTVLGLLIDDGKVSLDTPVRDILPEMAKDYPDLTLRHFAAMTSGYRAVGDEPMGTYTHGPSVTPFTIGPPLFAPPGSQYAYWDSAMNQFANALTRIAGEPIEDLFRRRIANPIGMNPAQWDWKDFGVVNGIAVNGGSGNNDRHMTISARELARFGLLFLREGKWRDETLLSASYIEQAKSVQVPAATPLGHVQSGIDGCGVYGLNWWVNGVKADGKRLWPDAPLGTYAASGFNNNDLFVVPEWDTVIVRLGLDEGERKITDKVYSRFLGMVGEAIVNHK